MSFLSGVDKRQEVNTNASMTVYVERDVNNFDFEKYNHLRMHIYFCLEIQLYFVWPRSTGYSIQLHLIRSFPLSY